MDLFNEIVKLITWRMRQEFPVLSDLDIAAIIGNLAHESGGFKTLQETSPTVKGSAGGYGWAQWTGPRRRAYMAWCKHNGLAPESHEANLGFLIFELKTSEAGAINKLRKATTLKDKVIAFELGYERAGIKHYDSRQRWAEKARMAIPVVATKPPKEVEDLVPPPPKPLTKSKTVWSAVGTFLSGAGGTVLASLNGIDWKVLLVLLLAGTLSFVIIYERMKK